MVRADPLPPPPSYGQRPYFDYFIFWDPSLSSNDTLLDLQLEMVCGGDIMNPCI